MYFAFLFGLDVHLLQYESTVAMLIRFWYHNIELEIIVRFILLNIHY